MNKILISLMMVLVLVSCVSAYTPHKQFEIFSYSFTSNNATACNLTTGNTPYGIITLDQIATKTANTFNVSIGGDYFKDMGIYCFNIVCTDGITFETGDVCREITPSGFFDSIGFFALVLILSLGLIIFGIGIKDAPITILGSFGLYFLGIYVLFYGLVGMKDTIYTYAIGIIILGVAFYVSTKSAWELIVDSE